VVSIAHQDQGFLGLVPPTSIGQNPNNPRRYFNEERLDLLRTSLQEVGVLVPLIVFTSPDDQSRYVLMDGERRWRCALDLALTQVPVNVVPVPSPLENILRMFNIHAVREDWPLISTALSLREVMEMTGEDRETRLAERTGLTRSTVRRAKRLLSMPDFELDLIQKDAHLDRSQQVHREDLYLEIEAAESVLRTAMPEIAEAYPRDQVIRQFAAKREAQSLDAVTDFRDVGKLVKAVDDGFVDRPTAVAAARTLIDDVSLSPSVVFADVAAGAYMQQTASRKAELLNQELEHLPPGAALSPQLRERLTRLRESIARLLDD
jgi:ParB/RepB/Spo0J family partition protein